MSTTLDRAAFSLYRTQLADRTTLSPEAEHDLAIRYRAGERDAGRRLVEACLPFVMTIALEYRRWGLPLEDIVQEGNIGLLKAAERFDPERGCRLATYAAYWIRAEIREYVVRAYRVVRLGTTKGERRALRAYRTTRETDPERLAQVSGLTPERVTGLLPILASRETSLDAQTGDMPSLFERLPAREVSPEEEVSTQEVRAISKEVVDRALALLSERERLIVRRRMMSDEPTTLQELGDLLGVSKERVRQLEERAKDKLAGSLALLQHEALAG
jgi:RNA polymerase sigma-32 factor